MLIDDVGSVKPNSVLLDNTTLFTCLPIDPDPANRPSVIWAGKEWADDLVERGMSNLIEALILHEAVYVDGESRYQAPIVERISEQFPELIRGVGVGRDREEVFQCLSRSLRESEGLDWGLYLIAVHASRDHRTGERLHLEHIYEFLLEEISARHRDGYLPEGRQIDPLVFRTFFYLALGALTNLPYTPYPLRNPILLALSDQALPQVAGGRGRRSSSEYYADIAHGLLQSFDEHVRGAISEQLQGPPISLPALPMPSFWEIIKQEARGDRRAVVEETLRIREQAKPYREFVGQLAAAYESGDITFIQRQHQLLTVLTDRLSSTTRIPRVQWKRVVVPVKVKLPFVELEQLSLRLPTPSPFRKPHFAFLHDWTTRRF